MSDLLIIALVIAIVVFVARRFKSTGGTTGGGNGTRSAASSSSRTWVERHLDQVTVMFPQTPVDRIAYDLSRTKSVSATVEKLLTGSTLPPVPRNSEWFDYSPSRPGSTAGTSSSSGMGTGSDLPTKDDLIKRYNLAGRLNSLPDDPTSSDALSPSRAATPVGGGSGSTGSSSNSPSSGGQETYSWSKSRSEREAQLKRRKEDAILQARARLLAREKEATPKA